MAQINYQPTAFHDESDAFLIDAEEVEQSSEDDLWFLPGPMEYESDDLPPGPRPEPHETEDAARLARVAGRVGALHDRLKRGPEGWRHRLALIEAADLSWIVGDRIGLDRLALWTSMRISGLQDDTAAIARVGWAVRRLTGGPGPEVELSASLDRRDPENLRDEAEIWQSVGPQARRACARRLEILGSMADDPGLAWRQRYKRRQFQRQRDRPPMAEDRGTSDTHQDGGRLPSGSLVRP